MTFSEKLHSTARMIRKEATATSAPLERSRLAGLADILDAEGRVQKQRAEDATHPFTIERDGVIVLRRGS